MTCMYTRKMESKGNINLFHLKENLGHLMTLIESTYLPEALEQMSSLVTQVDLKVR